TASSPVLVDYKGVLYAAWIDMSKLRVKMYNGTNWEYVEGGNPYGLNINPDQMAANPAMAVAGDELFVVWSENNGTAAQIRARKYDDGKWTQIDEDGLNIAAGKSGFRPSLSVFDNVLYAAWDEPAIDVTDNQIRVKKY